MYSWLEKAEEKKLCVHKLAQLSVNESHYTYPQARDMMLLCQGQLPGQQAVGEAAVGDETELLGEHDISSVSTISKASSNLTDIDGESEY